MKNPASTDFRTTEQIIRDEIEKDERRNHSSQPISLTREQEDEIGNKYINNYLTNHPRPHPSYEERHEQSEKFVKAIQSRDYERAANIMDSELSPALIMMYENLRWHFDGTH